MQNYAHYVPEHAERKKPSGNNRYESVPVVASFAIARKGSWPLFYDYIDWERGLRPLSIMYSFRWTIYTSYISICVNVLIDSVSSSKKVTVILSAWLKFHYARLWLLILLLNALDEKNPKILYGRRESRWECFHLSLWRCLSSRPCDSPPARTSFSLPLTAFTLDRSLPLPLGESCSSDLALAATFLLSRLRSLPPCSLEDPLALVVISSTHLWSCVTSRSLVYLAGLHPRVWHLFHRLI